MKLIVICFVVLCTMDTFGVSDGHLLKKLKLLALVAPLLSQHGHQQQQGPIYPVPIPIPIHATHVIEPPVHHQPAIHENHHHHHHHHQIATAPLPPAVIYRDLHYDPYGHQHNYHHGHHHHEVVSNTDTVVHQVPPPLHPELIPPADFVPPQSPPPPPPPPPPQHQHPHHHPGMPSLEPHRPSYHDRGLQLRQIRHHPAMAYQRPSSPLAIGRP